MLNPLKDRLPIRSLERPLAKARSVCRIAVGVSLLPLSAVAVAESAMMAVAIVVVSLAFFPVWYFGHYLEKCGKQRRVLSDG